MTRESGGFTPETACSEDMIAGLLVVLLVALGMGATAMAAMAQWNAFAILIAAMVYIIMKTPDVLEYAA